MAHMNMALGALMKMSLGARMNMLLGRRTHAPKKRRGKEIAGIIVMALLFQGKILPLSSHYSPTQTMKHLKIILFSKILLGIA
jgi:hypothetical protein